MLSRTLSLCLFTFSTHSLAAGQDDVRELTLVVHETADGVDVGASGWSAAVTEDALEVRAGGTFERLALAPAAASRDGWSAAFDHGPLTRDGRRLARPVASGVVERIDVRDGGLELSYVFDARPPGTGDLVVDIAVDTDLEARAGTHGAEGLTFTGRRALHVGGVLGIDAHGECVEGELRWDGRRLLLALPGPFVDAAAYPLVLDPAIGPPTQITGSASNDTEPDAAFDAATDTFAFVWNRRLSATDHLAVLQLTWIDGTPRGVPLVLGEEPASTRPTVAHCELDQQFVFAFLSGGSPDEVPSEVVVGAVRASDGRYKPHLNAYLSTTAGIVSADIGGDAYDQALVVLETDTGDIEAHKILVASSGYVTSSGSSLLHTGSTFWGFAHSPCVSNTSGAAGRWAVAWSSVGRGFDPDILRYAVIERSGAFARGPSDLEFEPEWAYRDVSCASNGDDFLFSYVRDSATPDEVWVRRLSLIGGGIYATGMRRVRTTSSASTVSGTAIDDALTGSVVAWREVKAGKQVIVARSLDPLALAPCAPRQTLQVGALGRPRACATASAGFFGEPGYARIVWAGDPSGSAGAGVYTSAWFVCP